MIGTFKRIAQAVRPAPLPTPELAAKRTMKQPMRTTVVLEDGTTTVRIIDWVDPKAKHRFGNYANRAIRAGGISKIEPVA